MRLTTRKVFGFKTAKGIEIELFHTLGWLEAEVQQCRLEPNEVIAGVGKENVDVLRESRET